MSQIDQAKRTQLFSYGFCQFADILDDNMLNRLRHAADHMLETQSDEHKARFKSQGSMFGFSQTTDPVFADLVAWPNALTALATLGFTQVTYTDGYLISKPPHSPQLFWHYDWFAWEEPEMFDPKPPQVFCMYYLTNTTVSNGCLRVIPGSHTAYNPLHDLIAAPHSEELGRANNLERAEFQPRTDEIDVPMKAGDLVIGDARLLHAAHANQSEQQRTVLTLWYQPDYASLPDRVKAQMVAKTQPLASDWPEEAKAKVAALYPVYEGDAKPHDRMYRPRQ
ncbi:MAG: phytanoyl-CoA dioxygenase family protein [Chloroflexota bacterium]